MSNWNPVTHPFRAMWIVNTDAPGLHGWSAYVVGCYATENEARTALFADRPRRMLRPSGPRAEPGDVAEKRRLGASRRPRLSPRTR
jgi:hypothetical protein